MQPAAKSHVRMIMPRAGSTFARDERWVRCYYDTVILSTRCLACRLEVKGTLLKLSSQGMVLAAMADETRYKKPWKPTIPLGPQPADNTFSLKRLIGNSHLVSAKIPYHL